MSDLRCERTIPPPVTLAYLAPIAIFEQHGPSHKEQFAIHAKGLVGDTASWISLVDLTAVIQYSISSEGDGFWGNKLRESPDTIQADGGATPTQDSVPLSVLNHPIGKRHESDFDAYDSLTRTIPPSVDGPDAA